VPLGPHHWPWGQRPFPQIIDEIVPSIFLHLFFYTSFLFISSFYVDPWLNESPGSSRHPLQDSAWTCTLKDTVWACTVNSLLHLTCVLSSRIQEPWSVCPHTSLRASEEEETPRKWLTIVWTSFQASFTPLTTLSEASKHSKKKKGGPRKNKLKFYLSLISTCDPLYSTQLIVIRWGPDLRSSKSLVYDAGSANDIYSRWKHLTSSALRGCLQLARPLGQNDLIGDTCMRIR
jgi:hypothetical protein